MTNGTAIMNLEISISDPDLYAELAQYPSGSERAEFAITAMKIGVMALRQAQGRIDAEQVRREGDRFIENLGQALTNHQKEVTEQVGNCLKSYFDPQDGRFNERVQRLVGQGWGIGEHYSWSDRRRRLATGQNSHHAHG